MFHRNEDACHDRMMVKATIALMVPHIDKPLMSFMGIS
jgi:hypothetical protein